MRILVTGARGQLGKEVARQGGNHQLLLTDHDTLNIVDRKAVWAFMKEYKPDAVIHCAAYTNVDRAEINIDDAFRVNVVGAQNIATGCLEIDARMVYVSTDYVFDGNKKEAYREFDVVNPQSVYGNTKHQGETIVRQILGRHYIIRTAWLYGEGGNFVRTMMNLAEQDASLRIVNDQFGTPTSTVDLGKVIYSLLETDAYGTYHGTCQGQCSWYEFANEIFRQVEKKVQIIPVTTSEFPRLAKRPAYSVLDNYMLRMTLGDCMRPWKEALAEYLKKG